MKKANGNYPNEVFIKEDDYEINDCLIKLYIRLTCDNDNPNLSDDKKEVVKKDFIKVLNNIKQLNNKTTKI